MSWLRRMLAVLKKKQSVAPTTAQLGMTLIEIMVVVAIIGLLMGGVGVVAFRQFRKAQVKQARIDVNNVKQALAHYALDHNKEPCPKDLKELKTEKLVDKDPKDPWGEEFVYKCPGEHDTDGADVMSKGPDRKEGSADDIKSWDD